MEELRRTTLSMGVISFGLSVMIFYSVFDIKATISRLPASLVMGATESAKKQAIYKVEMTCSDLSRSPEIEVNSELLQMQFKDCGGETPVELLNITNGYEATLFKALDTTTSDLIALEKGFNEIRIRLKEAAAPLSVRVNLKL